VRRRLILVPLVMGCTFDASGQGSGSSSGDDTTTAAGTTTIGAVESSGTTVVLDGSGSGSGSSSSGSTTAPMPETDTGTSGEPPPTAGSCEEILMRDGLAPTGIHTIARARDNAPIDVYCEMELDNGGWTLVGRSEDGPDVAFGWGEAQGTLGDENAPYSLDVEDVGVPFTEILVTRRTGFATPEHNAYVIEVLPDFLVSQANDVYEHMGVRVVLGDCMPNQESTMLRRVGYTANSRNFFMRDFSENHPYGLYSNGFRLFYNNCPEGADLDDEQGAIFVR
jgi:Fibrinogen beta and gamma chains, C-terminal globular domain